MTLQPGEHKRYLAAASRPLDSSWSGAQEIKGMQEANGSTGSEPAWGIARLADVERGRANNLNLIRFVLASSVILSHCYAILGDIPDEPMLRYLHFNADLGDIAVFGFFFISGFLIFKSALRQTGPGPFLKARALRILPGLALAILLLVFAVGPATTEEAVSSYFADGHTWHYLLTLILNHRAGLTLPAVFLHRPISEVDLPIWTLASEWFMYLCALGLGLACAGRANLARLTWRSWLLLAVVVLLTAQTFPLPWKYCYKWMLCFAAGSVVYLLRRRIPLSVPAAFVWFAADLLLIRFVPLAGKPMFPFALFYLLLVVGFHPRLLNRRYLEMGDFSYGIYIYGWPIQQIYASHTHSIGVLFWWSYLTVLPVAALSWYFVESPCLAFKDKRSAARTELAAV